MFVEKAYCSAFYYILFPICYLLIVVRLYLLLFIVCIKYSLNMERYSSSADSSTRRSSMVFFVSVSTSSVVDCSFGAT